PGAYMGPARAAIQQPSPARRRRVLPRRPLDRKERAEDRLFPVEIERVRPGKALLDLAAERRPARRRRPAAEPAQYRAAFGERLGLAAASRRGLGKLGQQLADGRLDDPVSLLGLGPRQPVGKSVQ